MFAYCSNNPIMYTDLTGQGVVFDWIVDNLIINPIDAVLSSIELQAGLGIGFGVDMSDNVSVEAARDFYVGLDDGKLVTGNVVFLQAKIFKFGIGDEYNHRVEENGERVSDSASINDGMFDLINYPDVTRGNVFSIGPLSINSSYEIVISASVSGHCIFGGNASAGFNVTEFIMRLIGFDEYV